MLPEPPQDRLVLMLAGDVMTGRGMDQAMHHPVNPALHEGFVKDAREYLHLAEAAHGPVPRPVPPAYPWGAALAEIERRAPRLRIVNLETAVTATGKPWPGKGIHYRMHPAHTDCLRVARLDACTLANNHVADWGLDGLVQTLTSLHAAGLQTAGAGTDAESASAPACWSMPGLPRVLLFSLAEPGCGVPAGWGATASHPGVALLPDLKAGTADQLARCVLAQRHPGDIVIVSLHWGGNWGLAVPSAHRDFAHRLIDAGAADVVHGHSSHHPMPLEVYQGRLVLYGCGDLINDYEGIAPHGRHDTLPSDIGCLYFVHLHAGGGALAKLEIVPFERRRLQLVPAGAKARQWMSAEVLQASTVGNWAWTARDGAWVVEPATPSGA